MPEIAAGTDPPGGWRPPLPPAPRFVVIPFRQAGGGIMDGLLEMGGYGAYVWPAYAVSAVTLAGLAIVILRRAAKAQKRLSALQRNQPEKFGD